MKNLFVLIFLTLTGFAHAVEFVMIPQEVEQFSLKLRFEVPKNGELPGLGALSCFTQADTAIQTVELNSNSELVLEFAKSDSGVTCNYNAEFGVLSNSYIRSVKTFIKVSYLNNQGSQVEFEKEVKNINTFILEGGLSHQWGTILLGQYY